MAYRGKHRSSQAAELAETIDEISLISWTNGEIKKVLMEKEEGPCEVSQDGG